MFDGLAIDDPVGCIFGMYSWYETLEAQKLVDGTVNCVIDTAAFLGKTHFPKAHLWGDVSLARGKIILRAEHRIARIEPFQSRAGSGRCWR